MLFHHFTMVGADRHWELTAPGFSTVHVVSLLFGSTQISSHQYSEPTEDTFTSPSSQCGPTALYRRPPAASALPPSLAAPQPGKKNKRASVEKEIKIKWKRQGKHMGHRLEGTKNTHCLGLVCGIPGNYNPPVLQVLLDYSHKFEMLLLDSYSNP